MIDLKPIFIKTGWKGYGDVLTLSNRFCSLTCCKRYSAEKRYYPYGRDEEGIAMSIREGLLNPNRSSRLLRAGTSKQVRDWQRLMPAGPTSPSNIVVCHALSIAMPGYHELSR